MAVRFDALFSDEAVAAAAAAAAVGNVHWQ
jgi:hypothetical protein